MLKIFGVQITPKYERTIIENWEYTFPKFRDCLMSWRTRILNNLQQRVDVIKLFGTSKLWYKLSGIPLPEKYAQMFESEMIKFIWAGKLEKLALHEIKNENVRGGLGLVDIREKADCLFIKSTCRILQDNTGSSFKHVKYWLGHIFQKHFSDMKDGPHAEIVPPYFKRMKELLMKDIELQIIDPLKLKYVTAKQLYLESTECFPPSKVVYKHDIAVEDWYDKIFKRLSNPIVETSARNTVWMLIHNIMPNRDRMFKFNRADDNLCKLCHVKEDNIHQFSECARVIESWTWLKENICENMLQRTACTNFDLLFLNFPED